MASSVLDSSTHSHFKKALGGSSTCLISEKGRAKEENDHYKTQGLRLEGSGYTVALIQGLRAVVTL